MMHQVKLKSPEFRIHNHRCIMHTTIKYTNHQLLGDVSTYRFNNFITRSGGGSNSSDITFQSILQHDMCKDDWCHTINAKFVHAWCSAETAGFTFQFMKPQTGGYKTPTQQLIISSSIELTDPHDMYQTAFNPLGYRFSPHTFSVSFSVGGVTELIDPDQLPLLEFSDKDLSADYALRQF